MDPNIDEQEVPQQITCSGGIRLNFGSNQQQEDPIEDETEGEA